MGVLRFSLDAQSPWDTFSTEQTHLAGLDGCPLEGQTLMEPGRLAIRSVASESGPVRLPWTLDRLDCPSELVLETTCLRQRTEPYELELELARGSVHRLREAFAELMQEVCPCPFDWPVAYQNLHQAFVAAILEPTPARRAAAARTVLADAVALGDATLPYLAQENLRLRDDTWRRRFFFGSVVEDVQSLPRYGTETEWVRDVIVPVWPATGGNLAGPVDLPRIDAQIQAARQQGRLVILGPLLDLDQLTALGASGSPSPERLVKVQRMQAEVVLNSFADQVGMIYVASGINPRRLEAGRRSVGLPLIRDLLKLTHDYASRIPALISFSQPFGDGPATERRDATPLHVLEALLRSGEVYAPDAIGLEWDVGYWPVGTLPRPVWTPWHQLRLWAAMQRPLFLLPVHPGSLGSPATGAFPPVASSQHPVALQVDGVSHRDDPQTDELSVEQRRACCRGLAAADGFSPTEGRPSLLSRPGFTASNEEQARFLARTLPLVAAHPAVQGVLYRQWADGDATRFPGGGLVDREGRPRPAMSVMSRFARDLLVNHTPRTSETDEFDASSSDRR